MLARTSTMRPPAERPHERRVAANGSPRYEIELDSVDQPLTTDDSDGDRAPSRRRLGSPSGIALAGVIGAVAVAGVVMSTIGDDSDEHVAEPVPGVDSSRQITTPPTLAAIVTLPPVSGQDQLAGSAPPTTRQAPLWRVPAAALVEFDLDTAVGDLDADVARTSRTRYAFDDHSIDAVIVHDPATDRDEVVLTAAGSRLRFVVDRNTSTVHLDRSSDALRSESAWDAVGGDRFVRPPAGVGLGEWIDRLMLGPVTPTSSATATVIASDWLTALDAGIGVARRFEVRLPPEDAPEWIDFPFDGVAPLDDQPSGPTSTDDTIELEVFVGQGSELIQVSGEAGLGDRRRAFTHQLERLADATTITLPGDALAISIPAASLTG